MAHARDFQQSRDDRVGDLVLAERIEILLVDRAASRQHEDGVDRHQGNAFNAPNVPGELAFCSRTPGTFGVTPLVAGWAGPVATMMSGLPSPLTSATAISLALGVA